MKKIPIILILLVLTLYFVSACGSTVSQQEYDRVNNELIAVHEQVESLQGKLDEAEILKAQNEELITQSDAVKSEYNKLKAQNEELNKQSDAVKSEYDKSKADYEELITQYQELSKKCSAVAEVTAEPINEQDAEQALFELINQERKNNGLDEMVWGVNLYKAAQNSNKDMVRSQQIEYPSFGSYQEALWVTGYTDADTMTKAVLTIWKNTDNYELKFLNYVTEYGAVAVYKSGEIYYITYISAIYR